MQAARRRWDSDETFAGGGVENVEIGMGEQREGGRRERKTSDLRQTERH